MSARRFNGHRCFAAFWDREVRIEGPRERSQRREVVAGAHGAVLEIGVGVGANWRYLPDNVDYIGIEPDPYMLQRAEAHAAERDLPIRLVPAEVEFLPFADATFDIVIGTLVFCTVGNPRAGLAEVLRVLKPGGEFRFWEHIRPVGPFAGRWFDLIQPPWSALGGGCHPNRRTLETIEHAGFELRELRRFRRAFIPEVIGVAAKPSSAPPG